MNPFKAISILGHLTATGVLVICFLTLGGCKGSSSPSPAATQPTAEVPQQTTFDSPDAAVSGLVAALRANDSDQLRQILGPESDDVLNSGDSVADQDAQNHFLASYDEKHQIIINSDGSATLTVGGSDWPMPIPIVKDAQTQKWAFDTDAGKEEIINRRVGRNELDVIQVCKAIVDAQKEYARLDPDHDGVPEYARKFISDPGTKNGLYWETAEGEPPSPLGVLVADAQAQGYATSPHPSGQPRPYHGYFYKILTSQGPDAPGGATDYEINGKLIGGFAVVAWPADYGNSGVMTFITNYSGDVYQADLGDNTDQLCRAMTAYDPNPQQWKKCE